MLDLLLERSTLIDGTGDPRRQADIGVRDGRVARIGDLAGAEAARRIDCQGLVVAPGFVDVHNHDEGWLLRSANLAPKTRQGITSEVLMSDGISYAPLVAETVADWFVYLRPLDALRLPDYRGWETLEEFLALLHRRTAQNVLSLVPFANLRVLALGWRRHPADDTQLLHMQNLLRASMDAGAAGLSTGLDYIAQCFSTTDEIAEVCRALKPFDGLYVTHVRYKRGVLRGLEEAVEIARRAEVRLHVSHLKGASAAETEQVLEFIDRVAIPQVDFSFDVYPYGPGSSLLAMHLPYEVWEDGPLGALRKLCRPDVQRRFAERLSSMSLDCVRIARTATRENAPWRGKTVREFVEARGATPAQALTELLIEEQMAVTFIHDVGPDHLVEPLLAHPKYVFGSDGIWFPDGVVHPRVCGSAPRMLGPLVRDRELFSLEDAVRRLSQAPAERFGMVNRGTVREGAWADIVVFNPETVADRATYESPLEPPVGIEHVFVAGTSVIDAGETVAEFSESPPGRVIRFRRE